MSGKASQITQAMAWPYRIQRLNDGAKRIQIIAASPVEPLSSVAIQLGLVAPVAHPLGFNSLSGRMRRASPNME